jgi:methyltransferase (TIGR00027 family)
MKEDRSSGTALSVAVIRASHQLLDEVPHILEDPVSLRLIGDVLADRILGDRERYQSGPMKALRSHVVLRSRYAEDSLFEAARSGMRQFVSLGAGYDTFAYRQPPWARALKILEVDHPATQSSKRDLLHRKGIEIPGNVEFLPLDFEKDDIESGIAGSGFDPAEPAFVACLGVLAYLRVDTVYMILNWLGKRPKLSMLVFTFATKTDSSQTLSERTAARGEPWQARFDPGDLEAGLRGCGFAEVRFFQPEEAKSHYYSGRRDLPPPTRVTMGQAVV